MVLQVPKPAFEESFQIEVRGNVIEVSPRGMLSFHKFSEEQNGEGW